MGGISLMSSNLGDVKGSYHLRDEELAVITAYDYRSADQAKNECPIWIDHRTQWVREQMLSDPYLLDIGCGHGRLFPIFAELRIKRFVGIDPSLGMLAVAKKNYPEANIRSGDVYLLPDMFNAKEFDAFWAAVSLMHLPPERMPEAVKAIHYVCKPGAIGVITLPSGEGDPHVSTALKRDFNDENAPDVKVYKWSQLKLEPILKKAGFGVLRWDDIDCMNFIVVCAF